MLAQKGTDKFIVPSKCERNPPAFAPPSGVIRREAFEKPQPGAQLGLKARVEPATLRRVGSTTFLQRR